MVEKSINGKEDLLDEDEEGKCRELEPVCHDSEGAAFLGCLFEEVKTNRCWEV